MVQMVKNPSAMWETWVRSLGWEDPLEKGTAAHSSILAWRIPQTEEPGRLQSMGSQRVRHDWETFTLKYRYWEPKKIFVQSFGHVRLFAIPWTITCQVFLSMEFSRQYWSGLSFPTLGDLPDSGIEPKSLVCLLHLKGRFFTTSTSYMSQDQLWKTGTILNKDVYHI